MARVELSRPAREVVGAWNYTSLDELIEALQEVSEEAKREGASDAEVYCDKRRISLVSEALTDGSRVLNLFFWDGE